MIGFFIFMMTVVLGALGLLWGLRLVGVIQPDGALPSDGGVRRAELERIVDALSALESRLDALEDQQQFLERLLAGREEGRALPGGQVGSERAGDVAPDRDEVDSILFRTGPEERP